MRTSKSGFTLIELLVVIVVIGILATIVILSYNSMQARTRDDRRVTDVRNIGKAMELYYSDNNSYPLPTGPTGSAINPTWYTSGDASWDMLSNLLVNSQAIDSVPKDPKNTANGSPLYAKAYDYAVFVNPSNYCGAGKGQMYIIVYNLENLPKEKLSDGSCTTNAIGDSYYDSGASYYRNIKG